MSKYLDLDDLTADDPLAAVELTELRQDAALLAWILTHPETAAEELELAAGGEGDARGNLEDRRASTAAARCLTPPPQPA